MDQASSATERLSFPGVGRGSRGMQIADGGERERARPGGTVSRIGKKNIGRIEPGAVNPVARGPGNRMRCGPAFPERSCR